VNLGILEGKIGWRGCKYWRVRMLPTSEPSQKNPHHFNNIHQSSTFGTVFALLVNVSFG